MWGGLKEVRRLIPLPWKELSAGGGVAGALALLALRLELKAARRRSEKRREEEIAGLW
jgi:hypothetical protein